MNKKCVSKVEFVVSELGMSQEISHGEFRRLVQLAMLPKDGKPSLVGKKIAEITNEPSTAITQTLTRLEKMGLVKRVENTNGAYEINMDKADWFPSDELKVELQNLAAANEMANEILEKIKAIKDGKKSKTKIQRKVG